MDAVSALDAATCILAATECITELVSTSRVSEVQPSLSQSGNNQHIILGTLKKLKTTLSDVDIPAAPQDSPSNLTRPSSNALEWRELVSSRDAATALVEDIEGALRLFPDETTSQTANAAAWLRSRLAGTANFEELKRLPYAITHQVNSILSSRMSELSQTLRSRESEERYVRPEHESHVDVMSRELDDLRAEVRKRFENQDENQATVLRETDIKLLRARLASLNKSEEALLANTIASSLNYTSRPIRFDSIPQAHKDTFKWAFESRLSNWFQSGSGTFWISGKPGSGKSTFMKFISTHPRTRELLAGWAGSPDALAVAAHFFWIAGTPIQKSWQGLLQSLLFDLLRGHPHAISLASHSRWAAAKAGRWQTAAEPWSVPELSAALRALATSDCISLRMCFFIDGLDEYDSNHAELCKVLRDMANSPHIKICLSSRRWAVFEENFGKSDQESLDIHKLTRNDIRKFLNDQLKAYPLWTAEASEKVASEKAEIVDQIVAQADGVFLWAFFVTRSLQEGLSNEETIEDLKARFSQLPSDLDQLFKHMLEAVVPADQAKMAAILQAAVHALEPLHVDLYWQLEREFEDHYPASHGLGESRAPQEITMLREQTFRSINEKTKGLLRVVYDRVEFLHRTVKDFVLTKDMGEYLRGKLPANYRGFLSIATAYLGFLKTIRKDYLLVANIIRQGRGLNTGPFIAHLNQALVYASEALKQTDQPNSLQYRQAEGLLDEYEEAIVSMVALGNITVSGINSRCDARLLFREELIRHDVTSYLANKIRKQPNYFEVFDESPLFAALTPMSRNSGESPAPVPGVLGILLRRGEDPNVLPRQPGIPGTLDAVSPWVLFARSTMSVFNMLSGPCMFPALRWNDALKDATFSRLMAHGADPNMPLLDRLGARTVFSHFLDISLSKFLGEECFEDYLRTLDAFLRAGASLGVPRSAITTRLGSETAFGNLARRRPEESVLASFCTELKGLLPRLAADPKRAMFVSSVVEKLVMHCSGKEDYLQELEPAISQGCPVQVAAYLSRLIRSELGDYQKHQSMRKRLQDDNDDSGGSGSRAKHSRLV